MLIRFPLHFTGNITNCDNSCLIVSSYIYEWNFYANLHSCLIAMIHYWYSNLPLNFIMILTIQLYTQTLKCFLSRTIFVPNYELNWRHSIQLPQTYNPSRLPIITLNLFFIKNPYLLLIITFKTFFIKNPYTLIYSKWTPFHTNNLVEIFINFDQRSHCKRDRIYQIFFLWNINEPQTNTYYEKWKLLLIPVYYIEHNIFTRI